MAKTYLPTDGMAAAARRALQWKKEGKRGGTRVGLTRANQLVNKEQLSEDTVLRMYSFFSRHEVDKRAQGFSQGEDGFPSPGRVAWDLWGGDAGASWSSQKRDQIMKDRMVKSIWSGVFFPADKAVEVEALVEEDAPLDEPVAVEPIVEPTVVPEQAADSTEIVEEVVDSSNSDESIEDTQENISEEQVVSEEAAVDTTEASEPAPVSEETVAVDSTVETE